MKIFIDCLFFILGQYIVISDMICEIIHIHYGKSDEIFKFANHTLSIAVGWFEFLSPTFSLGPRINGFIHPILISSESIRIDDFAKLLVVKV